jgi:hypothetical protein
MTPRKPAVRKKPTALWPYHHCVIASCTPPNRETLFDSFQASGTARLLTTCSTVTATMKAK